MPQGSSAEPESLVATQLAVCLRQCISLFYGDRRYLVTGLGLDTFFLEAQLDAGRIGEQRELYPPAAPSPDTQATSERIDIEDLKEVMNSAILRLPPRERLVIALYYYEELTLKEIGSILNVSESRISQIHTKAILRLKGRLYRALG